MLASNFATVVVADTLIAIEKVRQIKFQAVLSSVCLILFVVMTIKIWPLTEGWEPFILIAGVVTLITGTAWLQTQVVNSYADETFTRFQTKAACEGSVETLRMLFRSSLVIDACLMLARAYSNL